MLKLATKKFLLAGALATAFGFATTNVAAVAFPDFTVTEGSVPGAVANTFVADKITGNYVEVITFTFTGVGTGNFAVSLMWDAGQYVALDGTTPVASQLSSPPELSPNLYSLYALYQGSGTFVTSGSGVTTFTTNAGSGSLNVYIDPDTNTTFIAPATGFLPWTTANSALDYLIASGTPTAGTGTLDPSLPTCGPGINCGSFGTSSTFALTPAGSQYFTTPNPFYNASFQSGQLNNFVVAGTQTINGSLDVIFGQVPEPASLALIGIGLVGLAVSRRRRPQA